MLIREAVLNDIAQIQLVRNSVKENTLSDPALVTDQHCEEFLTQRGKGWVGEIDNKVVGFSIVDLEKSNVWALFLSPEFEGRGMGRQLHDTLINWYFTQTRTPLWLGTSPNTRAERFYRSSGWTEIGMHAKGEIKFEMTYDQWAGIRHPWSERANRAR